MAKPDPDLSDAGSEALEDLVSLLEEGGDAERMAEALLFASADPLTERELREALPEGSDVGAALEALVERYRGRGVELRKVGDGWAFRTAPEYAGLFERRRVKRRKLSRAATETLAIIAYHQPVTRSEVEEIRGVAVSRGTVHTLMELGWVGLGRRKKTPGRPVTYVVTRAFLDHFGLQSTRDLPGLKELKSLGLLQRPWTSAQETEDGGGPGAGTVETGKDERSLPAEGERGSAGNTD